MNTDKQPQTVYVPFDLNSERVLSYSGKKIENVYIFTTEELEALLQKEREADQWVSVEDRLPDIDTYVEAYSSDKGFSPINNIITKYSKYGFESASNVTHWRTLSQPSKE